MKAFILILSNDLNQFSQGLFHRFFSGGELLHPFGGTKPTF